MKKILLFVAWLLVLSTYAEETATLILADDFSDAQAFKQNWKIEGKGSKLDTDKKQVIGLLTLKKELPENFKVTVDFAVTTNEDKNNNARGGFIGITPNSTIFTVTPHGTYGIGSSGKKIEGYEMNKPLKLALIRKSTDDSFEYTFLINDQEYFKKTFAKTEKDKTAKLIIFAHTFLPIISNFKLYELK